MKKPDHRSSCNRLQSGPVLVFFPVARPDLETLAVVATPENAVISGLRCGHAGCYALFSTFEDSEEHALNAHSGNVAVSSNIHEKKMESGRVQLYRVLDEDGEDALQNTYIYWCLLPYPRVCRDWRQREWATSD
jgi:hypothetical protein